MCNDSKQLNRGIFKKWNNDERLRQKYKCLAPNCFKTTWNIVKESASGPIGPFFSSKMVSITYETKVGDIVKSTTEVPAYRFANFLADFGGYMGLLLGASLLSIYDLLHEKLKDLAF